MKAALLKNNLISKRDLMKMYKPPPRKVNLKLGSIFQSTNDDSKEAFEKIPISS